MLPDVLRCRGIAQGRAPQTPLELLGSHITPKRGPGQSLGWCWLAEAAGTGGRELAGPGSQAPIHSGKGTAAREQVSNDKVSAQLGTGHKGGLQGVCIDCEGRGNPRVPTTHKRASHPPITPALSCLLSKPTPRQPGGGACRPGRK